MKDRQVPAAGRPGGAQALLEQAGFHFAQARFADAIRLAEQGLASAPTHPDLLNLAGASAFRLGDLPRAERHWRAAIAAAPMRAPLHANLAMALATRGRLDEAEPSYRRALSLAPDSASTIYNLGLLLAQRGQVGEAADCYRRAMSLNPGDANAPYNLGLLLVSASRAAEAETCFRRAIDIAPDFAEALHNLGALLAKAARWPEAETVLRRALRLQPKAAASHHSLGIVLARLGRDDEAEASMRRALALQPNHAAALTALGALLARRGLGDEAGQLYSLALAAAPDAADTHYNLGLLHSSRGDAEAAEQSYRTAIAQDDQYADAHYNLGLLLAGQQRTGDAEACYRAALAIDPGMAQAARNLAGLLLQREDYADGWPLFEARYSPRLPAGRVPTPDHLAFPRWQGESLAGRSILVWHEQGLGDQIQFCRYVPLLKARGARRVTLVCAPPLLGLFASLAGVDAVVTADAAAAREPHDVWSLLLSLPLHLREAAPPARLPYLHAPAGRLSHWQSRLPAAGFRVGLAWRGSALNSDNALRSIPSLASLAPLLALPGLQFVSVQKGDGEDEARAAARPSLVALGHELSDIGDMAAILASLDLVISVDTVVAHLAGALGLPAWVLLRHDADWRWLRGRTDSPWYPGVMRLFRQPAMHDWYSVVADVSTALQVQRRG